MIKFFSERILAAAAFVLAATFAGCSYQDDGKVATGGDKTQTSGYGISIGTETTRAGFDGQTYKWGQGDRVGLYIADAETAAAVAANVKMTSLNTEPEVSSLFEGEVGESQIRQMNENGSYDYFSYYPYNPVTGGVFPAVNFAIPVSQNIEAGSVAAPVFMTAKTEGFNAITWLEGDRQYYGDRKLNMAYNHRLSYVDLYLALNLMSQKITKITMIDASGGNLAGTFAFNLKDGTVNPVAGSDRVQITVPGGTDVNSPDVRVAVCPRQFGTGAKLRFVLESADGNRYEAEADVSGKSFEAGKTHRLGIKIKTWIVNFSNLNGGDNITNSSFAHQGYVFSATHIRLDGSGIMFHPEDWGDNSTLRLPAINMNNLLGLTGGFDVKVSIYAYSPDPQFLVNTDKRRFRYGTSTPTTIDVNTGQVEAPFSAAGTSNYAYCSFNIRLTPEKPCLCLQDREWGLYFIKVQEIKIEFLQ